MSLETWVRLLQGIAGLVLVVMATFYCVAIYLEQRRIYLLFGIIALAALIPLSLLRIAAAPSPPLLPRTIIDTASLITNAIWPLFGLAWLALLLRDRLHTDRLRRKYLDDEKENGQ